MKRRTFVSCGLFSGSLAMALCSGLVYPALALANAWPRNLFQTKSAKDVIHGLFDNETAIASDAVKVSAPVQSDGMAVPIKVQAKFDGIDTIAIITENKNSPLASVAYFSGPVSGYSIRIRVANTSTVTAFIKANGKLYSAATRVKITKGGYGMTW
jgi:sulfur-oxidizing protein SoxY